MRRLVALALGLVLFPITAFPMSYGELKGTYEKSYIYEKSGDYQDAIKTLIPVYENYPNDYTINLRLGWLYYLTHEYANSKFHYEKALSILPSSVEAMLGLSLPLINQARWKDVETLMYRLLKIDYYNYYGNLRLCLALRGLKKFSSAETVARKMLSLYPTDVNFLNELALSLFFQGKKDLARSSFMSVLILDPENTIARKYLNLLGKAEGNKPKEK